MIKKLLNFALLLCMLVLGAGNVWGEEMTFGLWTTKPISGSNGLNVTGSLKDNKDGKWDVSLTGTDASKNPSQSVASQTTYWQLGANGNTVTAVFSTNSIHGTITKIVVDCAAYQGKGTASVTVGGTTYGEQVAMPKWTTVNNIGQGGKLSFDGNASGELIVTLSASTEGRAIYLSSIIVTYTSEGGEVEEKVSTTTSFGADAQSAYTTYLGETFTAPTATVTGEGLANASVTYSSSKETVATVDATTGAVTIVGAGTTTITASYAGNDSYTASSANYTLTVIPVFSSLEALAAAELASGTIVKVSFENVAIKNIFVTTPKNEGDPSFRNGIYFDIQKEDKDIEIYYQNVPETWEVGGTVSGTMTCPWKKYSGTWELAPDKDTWNWNNLTYAAPATEKETATITYGNAVKTLEVGESNEYTLTTNSDGELTVTSSNPEVATATLSEGNVTISALKAGTTTITFTVAETETYKAAEKKYTLTVKEPIVIDGPQVTFDLTKDETSTATDDKLEWSDVAVTMTADKANASTNTNNYYPGTEGKTYTSTRFYKSSTLTFTPASGITLGTIVYEATTADYASALVNSTWDNATASVNGTTVTITPTDGTKAVIATIGATTGAKSVTVSYTGTAVAGLSKIELSGTFPTEFTQGDKFSHEGMVVTAVFTDETTKDVTADATFSGYNMAEAGEQNVTVSYTEAEITKTCTYTINVAKAPHTLVPAEDGYETVDFTAISPYKDLESGKSAEIRDYDGTSFAMAFAKPQSSTTPTKYYDNGKAVRAYTGNTITITGAEEITDVDIAWVSGYVDDAVSITGIGTKNVVVTFSKTCRFTSITVYYKAFYTENTMEFKAQDEMGYWATFSSESPIFIPFVYSPTNYYAVAPMTVAIEDGELLPTAMNETFSEAEIDDEEVMGWYVPANTGILLFSENESITYYTVKGMVVEPAEEETNMLRPASAEMTGDYLFYKLAYNDFDAKKDLGFYWGAADGAAFTCKAGTAYLAVPTETAAGVKGFTLGTATGIQEVENASKSGKIFDLQGRQLNAVPTHGLYIQNGRKMFVK